MRIQVAYIEPDYDFTGTYEEYCFIDDELPVYSDIDIALKDLAVRQIEAKNDYPFGHQSLWVFIDEKKTPCFNVQVSGNIDLL